MHMLLGAGLIFLILAGLSFMLLMWGVLQYGVGTASNPPLTGWHLWIARVLFAVGFLWFVFLPVGAFLVVAGLIRTLVRALRHRKEGV